MSFFGHRLNAIGPHQRDGLLRLCALEPVGAVSLAHLVRRWERWSRGDVVVLGRPSRPAAGAWATGSLVPFGLAARPGLGHDGVGPAGARVIADHARLRLTRRGSVTGPAPDVEAPSTACARARSGGYSRSWWRRRPPAVWSSRF